MFPGLCLQEDKPHRSLYADGGEGDTLTDGRMRGMSTTRSGRGFVGPWCQSWFSLEEAAGYCCLWETALKGNRSLLAAPIASGLHWWVGDDEAQGGAGHSLSLKVTLLAGLGE